MANGYLRVAIEEAPNPEGGSENVSTVTFDIPYIEAFLDSKPTLTDIDDEVRGYYGPAQAPNVAEYAPDGTIKCRARPDTLGVLLMAACGGVTTTAGDDIITDPDSQTIPTGAHRHVFKWRYDMTNTHRPATFQTNLSAPQTGSPHWKGQGCGIETFGLAFDEGSLMLDLALRALFVAKIADPSITPSISALLPFVKGSCTLTWLTGSAATEDFSVEVRNKLDYFNGFTSASKFPDTAEFTNEGLPQVLGGSIPKRVLDADDYDALVGATAFSATAKFVHEEVIASTYKHKLWIQMPKCQYTGWSPESAKNVRQQKASFDFEAKWDTGTDAFATITLVNGTASLSSVTPS